MDRSSWPPGPWDSEPDFRNWIYNHLNCYMVRNKMGGWCGYVQIPKSHPWWGKDYDSLPVIVHGGLTYASEEDRDEVVKRLFAAPTWVIGFDCGHFDDLLPEFEAINRAVANLQVVSFTSVQPRNIYRDVAYVQAEVECLADQVAAARRPIVKWWRRWWRR